MSGFLQNRKEFGNNRPLQILSGGHGGKDDYKLHEDKIPHHAGRIQKEFYLKDKRTVKELGMESNVEVLNVADPKHREKFEKKR